MKCTRCIMHPKLRQSGWSDPAWICPVCKQSWWERDGKFHYEEPENEKKISMSKTNKFLEVWGAGWTKRNKKKSTGP